MPEYHFGQDLLDTYQSLSPFMQLAWLVVPFAFMIGVLFIFAYRIEKMSKNNSHGFGTSGNSNNLKAYKMMNQDLRERILKEKAGE